MIGSTESKKPLTHGLYQPCPYPSSSSSSAWPIVGAFVFLEKEKADSFPTIDAKEAKSDGGPGEVSRRDARELWPLALLAVVGFIALGLILPAQTYYPAQRLCSTSPKGI